MKTLRDKVLQDSGQDKGTLSLDEVVLAAPGRRDDKAMKHQTYCTGCESDGSRKDTLLGAPKRSQEGDIS